MDKLFAIFDMDGTLIDSMGYWRRLGREYLESKGITEDLTETLIQIAPMTTSESAALFVSRFHLEGSAESVAAEMNEMMAKHYRGDIPLKPKAFSYLESLKASGVRICVASATEESLMDACLKRLGIFELFDFTLSCERLNTHKREPKIYLEAAKRFSAKPSQIAVYEDALYAVETAKKAGFYVAAVYDEEAAAEWRRISNLADETLNLN